MSSLTWRSVALRPVQLCGYPPTSVGGLKSWTGYLARPVRLLTQPGAAKPRAAFFRVVLPNPRRSHPSRQDKSVSGHTSVAFPISPTRASSAASEAAAIARTPNSRSSQIAGPKQGCAALERLLADDHRHRAVASLAPRVRRRDAQVPGLPANRGRPRVDRREIERCLAKRTTHALAPAGARAPALPPAPVGGSPVGRSPVRRTNAAQISGHSLDRDDERIPVRPAAHAVQDRPDQCGWMRESSLSTNHVAHAETIAPPPR